MATLRYKKYFAELVGFGVKRQTVRRAGKVASVGEPLTHQDEHQRTILEAPCTRLRSLVIASPHQWLIDGMEIGILDRNLIAEADGCRHYTELLRVIRRIYGLPFNGQLINW